MEITLRKSLYWSLACHLVAFFLLIFSPYLPFKPYRHHEQKITWITLPKGVTGTFGASMKKSEGLPKTTIEDQKREIPEMKKGKEDSNMIYSGPKKSLRGPKTAEEKAMEKILAKASQEVASRKAAIPEAAQIPVGENGGFPEGVTAGSQVPPDDPELLLYKMKVTKIIMEEWFPSYKLRDPNLGLICRLIVRINERGEAIETIWDQKSGNGSYDASALRAVQKALPLPLPPEKLRWELAQEGILFDFNPAALAASGQ
ncbi:MAG: TonB C-terminal domain-containing protein [Deltaproteobacteria bacterium]|nr:TonB C-terminal domain-containing protein [Deltaproteobacteria bacterium]